MQDLNDMVYFAEVADEKGRKLYTLTWRNDRFHIRRTVRR